MPNPGYYVALADAVVDRINSGDYIDWVFTAERHYLPTYDLADWREVKVTVVPAARENKIDARGAGANARTYTIDVAIQKKLTKQSELERRDECDVLSGLVSAIEDRLERVGFSWDDCPRKAKWLGSEVDPLWSEDHLNEYGQFTAVIRLQYRD